MNKNVNYSYWEISRYFSRFDLIVVGSGIVGLSTAISFREKNKSAKVLVLERGLLPSGASTKNAGFACFGSPGELLDDLSRIPSDTVWQTVQMRWKGLQLLKKRLGEKNISYQALGGYELFDDKKVFEACADQLPFLNKMMHSAIGLKATYNKAGAQLKNFRNIKGGFVNRYEGQIDTGLMMQNLIQLAEKNGIIILNQVHITKIENAGKTVELQSEYGNFKASKVIVATNGFAGELLKIKDVKPARAQVLVTKPISNLKIKGAFHYQQGYYYFRNIDERILFGGGRNLDFETETTTEMELNQKIQSRLDQLLREVILPGKKIEVDHRWSGIMGVGSEKKPIIEFAASNVLAAVRMGGMGVAIGSLVGKMAAEKIVNG
jgi:glycine/D-amino acid oxidase-like deaminating enzyme